MDFILRAWLLADKRKRSPIGERGKRQTRGSTLVGCQSTRKHQ